jgi:2-phosphosulfolactate phosphatase
MRVMHEAGVEGARVARGVVVVIDVLRAFTVSAFAFARGAPESLLVRSVDEALQLQERFPGSVVSAEVGGRPIPGIPISNSPTQVRSLDLDGRRLIQRTSAGTQGVAAATAADELLAGSVVVASATAALVRQLVDDLVTLVAMGEPSGHHEDRACALYLEALLAGQRPDLERLLEPLRQSERYRRLAAGREPGFPASDLELALVPDRFDFAMQVHREDGLLKLRPARAGA